MTPDGVNMNQGAESTLSLLLSLLAMVESYALVDKTTISKGTESLQADHKNKGLKKKFRIEAIPPKTKTITRQVDKLV